ncbi:hypothetical protein [Pseudolactococcus piscium]|uniref:Prophage protein n=1 Tax=Pseudolactococcus piscium MKFS47 TaxID=297352 RepID=A0A0D6E004_9LACT|nr:hypothetical protein [Lactococcus piscium]CEN29371.1 Prophage protein [Lactococcus piscium MKFS47]
MDKQDIINFLLTEIEKQGFDIFSSNDFPLAAVVNINKKVMIQNPTTATPFKIAHELSHIINKDSHRRYDYDALNPQEIRANREAILLLWQAFEDQGGNFGYFSLFVELTDCPFELAYTIVSREYSEMIEAITEIYDEDISADIEKNQLHKYVIDYISSCNELESINIYSFLDSYQLDYDLYDMAKQEFCKLLGVA